MLKVVLKKVEEYVNGTKSVCKAITDLKNAEWVERELHYLKVKQVGVNYDPLHDALFALALSVKNNLMILNEQDQSLSVVLCYDHTALTPVTISVTTQDIETQKYFNVKYKFLDNIPNKEIIQEIFKGHRLFFEDKVQSRRSLISRVIAVTTLGTVAVYTDTTYHEPTDLEEMDQLAYLKEHVTENVDRFDKSVLPFRLVHENNLTMNAERMWDECFDKQVRQSHWTGNVQIIKLKAFRAMRLNSRRPSMPGNTIFKSSKDKDSVKFDRTSVRRVLTVNGIKCPGQAFLFHTMVFHPKPRSYYSRDFDGSDGVETSDLSDQDKLHSKLCMGQLKIYLLVTYEFMIYAYITLEHADSPPAHLDAGLLYYLGFRSSDHKVKIGSKELYCVSGYGAPLKVLFNFPTLFDELTSVLNRMVRTVEFGVDPILLHSHHWINPFDFLLLFTPSTMIVQSLPTDTMNKISRNGSHRIKCLTNISSPIASTFSRLNPFYYQLPCLNVVRYNQVGLNFHECSKIFFLSEDSYDASAYVCEICDTKYTFNFCALHCKTVCEKRSKPTTLQL